MFSDLGDVFVLPGHRGRGLGVWMVERMLGHPWLQGLRRIHLATADAHGLHTRFGSRPASRPGDRLDLDRSVEDLLGS